MTKNPQPRKLCVDKNLPAVVFRASLLLIFLGSLLLSGCGGGGGGGGSNPVGATSNPEPLVPVNAPAAIANEGQMVQAAAVNGAVAFSLPTTQTAAKFALVVTRVTDTSTPVTVTIEPESYILPASLRNETPAVHAATVPAAPTRYRQPGQLWIEQAMRQRRGADGRILGNRILANVDHSGEALNEIVPLNIYATKVGDFGTTYATRNFKLRRIGQHCKVFVDVDSYQGLSAVSGADAITEDELNQIVADFDGITWPLLISSYAQPYDIDQDGKVSLVFSPLVTINRFAGFFNTIHVGDASDPFASKSNNRDMVALFTPDTGALSGTQWSHERWLEAARETVAHECQHLANYSAHKITNNTGIQEDVWLDESLSVGIEARFRIQRGDPAGEDRFNSWASNPSNYSLTQFSWVLAQYGICGLFGHYLYEQGGSPAIKGLVNADIAGVANVNARFTDRGGMTGIFQDWAAAVFMEGLRTKGLVDLSKIDAKYKFQNDLGLNLNYQTLSFGRGTTVQLKGYSAAFYYIEAPAGFSAETYQFAVKSTDTSGVHCTLIRLK